MLSDGEIEPGPSRNGKATYRRVLRLDPGPNNWAAAIAAATASYDNNLAGLAGLSFAEELQKPTKGANLGQPTVPPPPGSKDAAFQAFKSAHDRLKKK